MEIEVNGEKVPVDITYHDSNEEPEEACTNRMVSFLVGERVYQYLNVELKDALADLAPLLSLVTPRPVSILCVVTKFRDNFFIDWPLIKRHAA